MRILTILGSPRKKGFTASILGVMEDRFKAGGHDLERINITDFEVKGCTSCYKCLKSSNELVCSQKDDALIIFEKMMKADIIVYSSPVYCWSWTAQIKTLVDRHYCLVKNYGTPDHKSFLENKKSALVVTCAGPIENNADLLVTAYNNLMDYLKINGALNLVIPLCYSADSITEERKNQARKLADSLTC